MRKTAEKRPFNQSKHKYNPAEDGYGTPEEWANNFRTQVLGLESERSEFEKILEVSANATNNEIRQAYIRLAKVHHPDRNPNNVAASTEKMKELTVAYNFLYTNKNN